MGSVFLLETPQRISGTANVFLSGISFVLFIASCELYTCVLLVDMKLRERDVTFRRRLLMSVSTK